MRSLFGESFHEAPTKLVKRMKAKIVEDLRTEGFGGFDDALVAAWAKPADTDNGMETLSSARALELRTLAYRMEDVVRGSVAARGAAEMKACVERLRECWQEQELGTLEVWRIKNT